MQHFFGRYVVGKKLFDLEKTYYFLSKLTAHISTCRRKISNSWMKIVFHYAQKKRGSLFLEILQKNICSCLEKKTGKNFKVVLVTANYYRALIYETSWSTLSDRLEKRRNLFQWLVRSYVVRRQHHHYYYTSSLCRLPKNLPQPF